MRPWNIMNAWDETTIVCYPAADPDDVADPDEPPVRLVRLHKALGDERRLRMLKLLSRRSATLQELADATGLAKSSAHHHTVILRSAGLLTVTLEDNSRYALREGVVPEVSRWLTDYVQGGAAR
jgi:DNA-binding transcriptional ArsR family regulator